MHCHDEPPPIRGLDPEHLGPGGVSGARHAGQGSRAGGRGWAHIAEELERLAGAQEEGRRGAGRDLTQQLERHLGTDDCHAL